MINKKYLAAMALPAGEVCLDPDISDLFWDVENSRSGDV